MPCVKNYFISSRCLSPNKAIGENFFLSGMVV